MPEILAKEAEKAAAARTSKEKVAQISLEIKKTSAKDVRKDFTDYRTDAEMHELHRRLREIKPQAEDFLYTPQKERLTGSLSQMQRFSHRLNRDKGVVATPIEVSAGQWKLRVDKVPPPPSLQELRQSLRDMYSGMLCGEKSKISLGVIGPEEAARIKARTKTDTLLCVRELDTDGIQHAFGRHGNERTPGQISITERDFVRYAEIVLDPHSIDPGTTPKSIKYSRRYTDGTVYVVEQQIKGSKLEFRTLWKQSLGGKMEPILTAIPITRGEEEE